MNQNRIINSYIADGYKNDYAFPKVGQDNSIQNSQVIYFEKNNYQGWAYQK